MELHIIWRRKTYNVFNFCNVDIFGKAPVKALLERSLQIRINVIMKVRFLYLEIIVLLDTDLLLLVECT